MIVDHEQDEELDEEMMERAEELIEAKVEAIMERLRSSTSRRRKGIRRPRGGHMRSGGLAKRAKVETPRDSCRARVGVAMMSWTPQLHT